METWCRRMWGLLLITILMASVSAAYAGFVCPITAAPTKLAMPDLATTTKPYSDPRDEPALASAISRLENEGMMKGEIVDHVVASYCPTVNALPNLSDREKDMLVTRFASHLAETIYAPGRSNIDAIILDVPVPPALYSKVKEAAEQHKESQDAFVLQALRQAAGTP